MSLLRSVARSMADSCMPSLLHAYRRLRDERAASAPSVPTPFGFSLTGNDAMANGSFERDEVDLFITQLHNASVCVDIGANAGLYTCLAASHRKHVIAIEPLSANQKVLYKNLVHNGFLKVEVFPLGLSGEAGIKRLFGYGTGAS